MDFNFGTLAIALSVAFLVIIILRKDLKLLNSLK